MAPWDSEAAEAQSKPDPKCSVVPGGATAPPEPHQLPRGQCVPWKQPAGDHPHPPSPATLPSAQRVGTEGHLETGPQQAGEGEAKASNPLSATLPTLRPPGSTSTEVVPSSPQTRPLPRPAHSRPFLFPPQAHGSTPPASPGLKTPSLHLPSPRAGERGQCPLQNPSRDGSQFSVFLVPRGGKSQQMLLAPSSQGW